MVSNNAPFKIGKRITWLMLPAFGIIVFLFYINSYAEFEPVVFQSEDDSYRRIDVDAVFYKDLEIVLHFYQEPYKMDHAGKVLVKQKLKLDKELVFNYTQKALDKAWLKSHQH